ncbi:cardiolipin synthase [Bacillus sonorensis]|uniref:cardiolipin synthase n=1 Tax=Bacillus sonorensis TaxID=119858 RepID=UPI001F00073B|nr:cardiolipin synthase [Bacillus sonorensis]MCF7616225.1 cardiolipin synthase [Bacillus sonorensis]
MCTRKKGVSSVVPLMIILLIITLLVLDFYFGRKAFQKKAYEPVFPEKKSDIELIHNGEDLCERIMDDIRQAASSVHVMFYIIKHDDISLEFLNVLKDKAEAGVSVYLLIDRIGAMKVKRNILRSLEESGAHVHFTNRPSFPFFFYRLNARNHRKAAVIDGKIGYVGGFNIAMEYLGKKAEFGPWKDYHLRMTGEGVADLQHVFLTDVKREAPEAKPKSDVFPPLHKGSVTHTMHATRGFTLEEKYVSFIEQAKERIMICTPYYIPSQALQQAVLSARKRGVIVSILIPMKADHPLVKEAAFTYFNALLEAGCFIYRYYRGFYHAKALIVDDRHAMIGTSNFDNRSLFLNDEMNVIIHDKEWTKQFLHVVKESVEHSELLTRERYARRPLLQRPVEWLARSVAYFL